MKNKKDLNETKICELYINGSSTYTIADIMQISRSPICKILRKNNIKMKKVGHPKIFSCKENIFQEDNEFSFYLAGFIAADGTLRKQKYSKVLKISLSKKDENHLKQIQKLLENNSPIKHYKTKIKNKKICNNKAKYNEYEYSELTITSSKIFDDLDRFNIVPNKTSSYTMPDWLISHNLVRHFIRGYIDGDGSICISLNKKYLKPQASLSIIGNKNLIDVINKIFIEKCKINGSKINHKPGTKHTYRIRFSGNKQMKKLANFLYSDSNIFLRRKIDKINFLL